MMHASKEVIIGRRMNASHFDSAVRAQSTPTYPPAKAAAEK